MSSLVLCDIFDRFFLFLIFLAFELYHMVDSSTVQCPLSVFGVRFFIKGPVQSQFKLLQKETQNLPGEITYLVSLY